MVDRSLYTRDWKKWKRTGHGNLTANVDGYTAVIKGGTRMGEDCAICWKLPWPHKEWAEYDGYFRTAREAREVLLDILDQLNRRNGYGPLYC